MSNYLDATYWSERIYKTCHIPFIDLFDGNTRRKNRCYAVICKYIVTSSASMGDIKFWREVYYLISKK